MTDLLSPTDYVDENQLLRSIPELPFYWSCQQIRERNVHRILHAPWLVQFLILQSTLISMYLALTWHPS